MKAVTAIAFPIVASLLAFGLAISRSATSKKPIATRWQAITYVLKYVIAFNLAASVAFGIYITVTAPINSSDSLWFLPIFFAPLEYWLRFGPALLFASAVLAFPVATLLVRQPQS